MISAQGLHGFVCDPPLLTGEQPLALQAANGGFIQVQQFHQLSGFEAAEEFCAAVERQQAGPDRAFRPFHPFLDAFQLKSLT